MRKNFWTRRKFVSKAIKLLLMTVLCGTIAVNLFFIVETTKKLDSSDETPTLPELLDSHKMVNKDGTPRHPRNLRHQVSFKSVE
jgi:hypothetical protein